MVFISRLKLRNFKSFKAADIQLPRTYTCFAGPNGSGKSNLCDAIRFGMGETSLRSLRARNSKELIHTDSKTAEVTIVFDGENGEGYEIKRAIRSDGKMMYRMDGKKVTRMAILEALKKHNLDESGRNTIAQGEVQRILNMNGKERRLIIDSVAGIADFETKKKEAMGELTTVETRIKDANLILGERRAFLDELGNEKEVAIKYTESKKTLANAKGTLLRKESERFQKELADIAVHEEKIQAEKKRIEEAMAAIDAKVKEVEFERAKTSHELQSKQKTNELIQKVEKLKASCGSREQLIEDKKASITKLKSEAKELGDELETERKGIEAIEKELKKLGPALVEAEKRLAAEGGMAEDKAISEAKRSIEAKEKELAGIKERLIGITSEIASKRELITAKTDEEKALGSVSGEGTDDENAKAEGITRELRSESANIAKEIEASFSRTKEINGQMGELDRQMLDLKENASIFKVRSSPHLANPALSFVKDLSAKDKRIKGLVADLISFEPKFAAAVEASAGSRLLYVVVDGVDTATETIEKLKRAKAGRATFIPLDRIKTAQRPSGGKLSVIDVISYPEEARAAFEYVFAETVLVDDVATAKKAGIGTCRMVTLDGEIFERSGVISGGRTDSGILSGNQLRKIENELLDVKSTKDSLLQELYSIREQESHLRAEKSQIDIRIKTIEMETRMGEDKRKDDETRGKRREQIRAETKGLDETIVSRTKENVRLAAELESAEKELSTMRERLHQAEESFKMKTEETSKKRADLSAEVSSLRATIEGRRNELGLRNRELLQREQRINVIKNDEKSAHKSIEDGANALGEEKEDLKRLEEKITSASKEIEKLFGELKSHEQEFSVLGKQIGEKRLELERLGRDLNQLEIKKASASTRLDDMKTELANYMEIEILDLKKDELNRMVAECERTLAGLGNVNMAAIEMFDRKKAEIEEVEERIKKLDEERGAIMSMINEIEEHKKDSFFETFQAVSDNFSKMFQYIDIGQGHLYLDKPATPFDSGLFIKIRRNNKDYSLDALSGGERTLVALMFIFAMQLFKPSPFYILDEVDSALDKPNSQNLAELIHKMANNSQFIVVSHNDIIMSGSDSVIGVAKVIGTSKLVGVKLKQVAAA